MLPEEQEMLRADTALVLTETGYGVDEIDADHSKEPAGMPVALISAWAFELTPEGVKREKDVDRSKTVRRQTGRKLDFIIIAILTIAVLFFVFDKFV